MTSQEEEAYIERRQACMAHCSFKELIADLRGQKELVIKWDMEHKRCANEVLEVLLK